MSIPLTTIIFLGFLTLAVLPGGTVHAGDTSSPDIGSAWDNAVNSLLATGMYGFDRQNTPGLTVQLQHSQNMYKGLAAGKAPIDGQAITFSYDGSSGLLEFSAGFMLTSQRNNQEPGTIFLGVDDASDSTFNPGRSWYMAFDLSRSYQIDDTLSFSLGSKTMLLKNPFDTEEGHIFSVLFNMPISYKNYLTITPELQWSRPVSRSSYTNSGSTSSGLQEKSSEGVFYGGVSVSFSY
jgi:hypothetical protein